MFVHLSCVTPIVQIELLSGTGFIGPFQMIFQSVSFKRDFFALLQVEFF